MKKSPFAVDTDEERRLVLPEFRRRAMRFACSRRMKMEDAEEFASFAMIEYLRSGRYAFEWLVTDFWRELHGRKGLPSHEGKRAMAAAGTIDALLGLAAPDRDLTPQRDVQALLMLIPDERTRRMLRLFLDGYTLGEIGELEGGMKYVPGPAKDGRRLVKCRGPISESRVSQILTQGLKKIRRRLGLGRTSAHVFKYSPLAPAEFPAATPADRRRRRPLKAA